MNPTLPGARVDTMNPRMKRSNNPAPADLVYEGGNGSGTSGGALIQSKRQLTDTNSARCKQRIGDCRRDQRYRMLAESSGCGAAVEQDRVQFGHLADAHHVIVREIFLHRRVGFEI